MCTVARYADRKAQFLWVRVLTSSGNHGKPGKSGKKVPCMDKIMEFEKNLNNHGKIMELC